MKYLLYFVVFFTANSTNAQRVVVSLNKGWQFSKDNFSFQSDAARWQNINLPHTWNVDDVMDDEPGYYRGPAWYKKVIPVNKSFSGKRIFLHFEGANQEVTVLLNGKNAGTHVGGYNAFSIDITALFDPAKENELLVKVDNSHNKNIPPLTADFTFYGGIYRDVYLIATAETHFSLSKDGSKGIFIATPEVNNSKALLRVRANVDNESLFPKKVILNTRLYDAHKKLVRLVSTPALINASVNTEIVQDIHVAYPTLWSVSAPYLYKAVTSITDATTGRVLDEVEHSVGFRWFSFDAGKGFFLNGKSLKLIGASRHQDRKGLGNAVPDSLARKDVMLLKEMGANFLRVAHYPQDPAVLKACDELGILASVEIPVVNEITETDSFYNNCIQMQVEMIRQHYNHPSVILWCYMNEILLRPSFNDDKARQAIYFSNIAKLARTLDSITRKEDPFRYTMIAHHGNYNQYKEVGLIDIPMIVGWNLYQGWYGSKIEDLPLFLDRFHRDYPQKPMMITEYGADADPRVRSAVPVRFDKSIEYATYYHQYYFGQIMQRPFVAGAQVWNLADFNSETRNESMPHINNKGLLQWDRTPKDPYYFYKAKLTKKPFVKIIGELKRTELEGAAGSVIRVATNLDDISLFINGVFHSSLKASNGIAQFAVNWQHGKHLVEVRATKTARVYSDKRMIEVHSLPNDLRSTSSPFSYINILAGANRTFVDSSGTVWIPGKEYQPGGWGNIGGKAFKIPKSQLPYGTDKNIKGTFNDPIYQTQLTGLTNYKLDVPDGDYEVTFHFAELMGGKVEGLVYNLEADGRTEETTKRIFSVFINDQPVIDNFNMAQQFGNARAIVKMITIKVDNNSGINIVFKASEGESVLNALQVKKIN
ncbi:MAG: glycoside hydrolase family 2 [Chitinophagaceae bacterium]|nr:MAG: glycoside hydrolase family 2 [Chitinophagaceae bacterium]